jgi:ribulose-phosphate 3-epimerase
MDGHFVPNLSYGPVVVQAVRNITEIPLDCHLMIYNPEEWIDTFAEAGVDRIAFHLRAGKDAEAIIGSLRKMGISPGLALSPEVPVFELKPFLGLIDFVIIMCVYPGFGGQSMMPEMLNRIGAVKRDSEVIGTEIEVEVDGGVNSMNLPEVIDAGADTVVVGSSIFKSPEIATAASEIRSILDG